MQQALAQLQDMTRAPALVWAFAAAAALNLLLVLTARWHGRVTQDPVQGVQKFHESPTPRIGGLGLVFGALAALAAAPAEVHALLAPLLLASTPAFLAGLGEDITKRVGVRERLLATLLAGVLAWALTGYSLQRVDVWGLDRLLAWLPLSVLFTAFAVGGVANALNIVDGFNGLAASLAALAFAGLGLVALNVGDIPLASVCFILVASVLGFFCLNWPLGKIFLGDGGAYFLGFALAWVGVLLVERNAGVSAFAPLLVVVYPVTEVLFSIFRRLVRRRRVGMPDRLHLHTLIKRRYVARWLSGHGLAVHNSVTGLAVGGVTLLPVGLVQVAFASAWLCAALVLLMMLGYVLVYARVVRYAWCSPIRFLFAKAGVAPVGG